MDSTVFLNIDDARLALILSRVRDACLDPPKSLLAAMSETWPGSHGKLALNLAFSPFDDDSIKRLIALGASNSTGSHWLLAILAGKIPALAANVLMSSWAARTAVKIKPSAADNGFVQAMVQITKDTAPELQNAIKILNFDSKSPELAHEIQTAPLALVYGSDATTSMVQKARKGRPTTIGAHRESGVLLSEQTLNNDLLAAISHDICIYDQSGCLSPQFILTDLDATAFAKALYEALLTQPLPSQKPTMEQAVSIRLLAQETRFSGFSCFPAKGPIPPMVVTASVYKPGPGHRVIQVIPFEGLPDLRLLLPTLENRLQGLAFAGPPETLQAIFAKNPAYIAPYICKPSQLQNPPAGWPENGQALVKSIKMMLQEFSTVQPTQP